MKRDESRFAFVFHARLAGPRCRIFACQKEDPRPPVSDGPGTFNPNNGQGTGNGGEGGSGGGSELATFPNFVPSGLTTSGDIAIVTLSSLSAGQAGEVVQVTSAGTVTVLVGDAGAPTLPAVGSNALYYFDAPNGGTRSVMKLDLGDVSSGPQSILDGVEEPGGMIVHGSDLLISSSAGGTGIEVDSVPTVGGSTNPVSSVSGAFSAGPLATDNTNVYFVAVSPGAGEIRIRTADWRRRGCVRHGHRQATWGRSLCRMVSSTTRSPPTRTARSFRFRRRVERPPRFCPLCSIRARSSSPTVMCILHQTMEPAGFLECS